MFNLIRNATAAGAAPTLAPDMTMANKQPITGTRYNQMPVDGAAQFAVELCIAGSAGNVSGKVRVYLYMQDHWTRIGEDADYLEISRAFDDVLTKRKLLFLVDAIGASAIAVVVEEITGTDAMLTVNVLPLVNPIGTASSSPVGAGIEAELNAIETAVNNLQGVSDKTLTDVVNSLDSLTIAAHGTPQLDTKFYNAEPITVALSPVLGDMIVGVSLYDNWTIQLDASGDAALESVATVSTRVGEDGEWIPSPATITLNGVSSQRFSWSNENDGKVDYVKISIAIGVGTTAICTGIITG